MAQSNAERQAAWRKRRQAKDDARREGAAFGAAAKETREWVEAFCQVLGGDPCNQDMNSILGRVRDLQEEVVRLRNEGIPSLRNRLSDTDAQGFT